MQGASNRGGVLGSLADFTVDSDLFAARSPTHSSMMSSKSSGRRARKGVEYKAKAFYRADFTPHLTRDPPSALMAEGESIGQETKRKWDAKKAACN